MNCFTELLKEQFYVIVGTKDSRQVVFASDSFRDAVRSYRDMCAESRSGYGPMGFQPIVLTEHGSPILRFDGCPSYLQEVE